MPGNSILICNPKTGACLIIAQSLCSNSFSCLFVAHKWKQVVNFFVSAHFGVIRTIGKRFEICFIVAKNTEPTTFISFTLLSH